MNPNKTLPTVSARAFSTEFGVPIATVTAAAKHHGIKKSGTADNSPLLLTPEAQCKVFEFHKAELEREIAQSKREIIATNNELIKQAEFLCSLTGLTGSPVMMRAAEESLAEHRANKLTCLDCSAARVHTAATRIQAMIANYRGSKV